MTLYRFFMSLWPVTYLLFPILNLIAKVTVRTGVLEAVSGSETKPAGLVVWTMVGVILALNRLASMAYS